MYGSSCAIESPSGRNRAIPTGLLLAAAYLLALFLAIYGPAAGQGFIADDYGWMVNALPAVNGDLVNPFLGNVGFYRPLVTLSFGVNYALFGLDAKPYGITNVLLALSCAGLLIWLVRLNRLNWGFALFAGALWLFNFHGINMAVLWTSGRTSLLLTAFALGAAIAFLKDQPPLQESCRSWRCSRRKRRSCCLSCFPAGW